MPDSVVDLEDKAAVLAALEAREYKIAELLDQNDSLTKQLDDFATERRQYQQRIVELSQRLGAPVSVELETRERNRARCAELEQQLSRADLPQAERNVLAVEHSQLLPTIGY